MAEANLPARRTSNSLSDGQLEGLIDRLADGQHPRDIAKSLAPGEYRKQRRIRRRLERAMLMDGRVAEGIGAQARVSAMVGLGPAMRRLAKRAQAGHFPSTRLLLEITGYYNPKTTHEHHGEIKISVDIPRPDFTDGSEAEVVDADVVE